MKVVTRAVVVRFLGERGATAVEYGLMLVLIAMAMFGTLYVLGPNLNFVFDHVADGLSTPAPPPPPGPGPGPGPQAPPSADYEDCDAVRAAGADPILVGDPGYRPEFDTDGDGIGCE